jgi:dTDP-glucose pyrophosphorylase
VKALILAAGRGSRLGPLSADQNKCLVPIGGRAVIEFSLDNAIAAGAREAVIVVGYRGDDIVRAVGRSYRSLSIEYVHQEMPSGVVDAMSCARDALAAGDFVLFFADELLVGPRHDAMVRQFEQESLFALIGIVPETDPAEIAKTYEVVQDATTGLVRRLVEKPERPTPGFRGTGNCVFRNAIFDYVARAPVNPRRGEREFPDLVQCAIDDGRPIRAALVAEAYVNVNTAEDLAAAQQRLAARVP